MLITRSRKQPITLDMKPVEQEVLSAKKFLELAKSNPANIKSSRLVMPQQGERGFGAVLVEYVHPKHKAV
jgi:hypothetical protein